MDELIELRHQLHSIAELSGKEEQTARKIVEFLKGTGCSDLTTGVGGHGILARFPGEGEGPRLLLRCELDALPIPEENEFDYRSRNEDTGHKCGHDGHMAIMCGVARELAGGMNYAGEVLLLFQPAEETGQGAQRVLEDPAFEKLEPDFVFALHNLPGFKKHRVVTRAGTFAAASIGLNVQLQGETSHAAHPEEGRSPALAVAQLINAYSSLPQFYTSLDHAAKVTIIHARLGEEAYGTSPGFAEIMATLRTYDDETLLKLKERAVELAEEVAGTYGLDVETEWVEGFAATRNDEEAVSLLEKAAQQQGIETIRKDEPFGWSEDFGHFTKAYRGALFGLGSGEDQPALHAGNYDFPDDIIPTGVRIFTGIIEQVMGNEDPGEEV